MSDEITFANPCRSGCTMPSPDEGGQPIPVAATNGDYCHRCAAQARTALENAGALVGFLVNRIGGLHSKGGSDGSQKTKGAYAPLPLNTSAFDAANTVYATTVRWQIQWATVLGLPVANVPIWRDMQGTIIGMPFGTEPTTAHRVVSAVGRWHLHVLDRILASGRDEMVKEWLADLRRVTAINIKWPQEDRAKFSERAICPDDSGRILIAPPREPGASQVIVCATCGRHFSEAEHEVIADLLLEVTRREKRARKSAAAVQARLMAEYLNLDEDVA